MIVSRKEFARELNITKGRVSQYASQGMPVVPGGVDRELAIAWIIKTITPQAGIHSGKGGDRANALRHGPGKPLAPGELSPPQERARRDRAAALKLRIANERTLARTCELDAVEATLAPVFDAIHAEFAQFGARLAPLVATLTNPEEIKAVVDKEACASLTRLVTLSIGGRGRRAKR